ncbi:MAG: carboxypeptidase-like regulatory domain-containing protein, partial [Bacteroidota bacterium]
MKQRLPLLFLLLFSFVFASAQSSGGTFKGTVQDAEGSALPYANVLVYNAADSSFVKAGYSDDNGKFNISPVPAGQYWLRVTFLGNEPFQSEVKSLENGQTIDIPTIKMKEVGAELKAVQITTEKPLVTVKPDMTVFNVEGTVNAIGENAFDLLRKAPGVVVDNNDNIMLQGKAGVRIYIDGKPSYLS